MISHGEVLIETYWNVNTFADPLTVNSLRVLIETYWNVNLRGAYTNGITSKY